MASHSPVTVSSLSTFSSARTPDQPDTQPQSAGRMRLENATPAYVEALILVSNKGSFDYTCSFLHHIHMRTSNDHDAAKVVARHARRRHRFFQLRLDSNLVHRRPRLAGARTPTPQALTKVREALQPTQWVVVGRATTLIGRIQRENMS